VLSKSAKIAKIINNSTTHTHTHTHTHTKLKISTNLLTMTKKKASKTQKSTLDTMPITPPRLGGRTVPRGFIPYDGTIEEEIEALKLVFRLDGSNPYKDDAYNINQFKPMSRYEEADYHTYLVTLHSDMDIVNKYVAIQDLMKHMFSTQHVWVPSDNIGSRYMYSTSLYEYLHQSETPLARTVVVSFDSILSL
jgi:hypothetical protein